MSSAEATTEDPARFLGRAEDRLRELSIETSRAQWVYATHITPDTEALSARAYSRLIAETVTFAKQARHLEGQPLPPDLARKARLLRTSLPLVAPSDPAENEELTRLVTGMQATYAKGAYQPKGASDPLDLQALSRVLAESRDPGALADVWTGWHEVGRTMKAPFERYVALANRGAREVGFADTGAMWKSRYDMSPEAFARDVERLWQQVRPFYATLHAFVRSRLAAFYGPTVVPEAGPIPAHLLGNMWAQSWEHVLPLLGAGDAGPGFDLTDILVRRGTQPIDMVRYGEAFFVSLGLDPLPATFWERSQFTKPRDREVVCHASAWDIDAEDDVRIKMCIEITGEEFGVIHHELGHNYYQRAYRHQPFLFREDPNDGFHEAIGDTIGLSVTPEYLQRIGLLGEVPDPGRDLGRLLRTALEKITVLPWAYAVDLWRWRVFAGETPPEAYTRTWWEIRREYQGIAPPLPRAEATFDPGAKYHIAANVPYIRYFLADVLQFQFHRALARAIGWSGPLHRCSIYGSRVAGDRLRAMLALGASRPWPDALEALTGERTIDAGALLEYFAPLTAWLREQTRDVPTGW